MPGLRFAVLLTGDLLEHWHARCLDELQDVAELAAVISLPERSTSGRRDSLAVRWLSGSTGAFAPAPPERFSHVPTHDAGSLGTVEPGEWDFVLKLGSCVIPAGLERATRLGVWYFDHERRGTLLPFFRQVYDGDADTRAALLVRNPGSGAVGILETGVFRTDQHSYRGSRDAILHAVSAWPARCCRRVLAGAGEPAEAFEPDAALSDAPGALSVFRYFFRVGRRRLQLAWHRLFRHQQWSIGVLDVSAGDLLTCGDVDERIEWLPLAGRRAFFADPFGIVRDGITHVLCECFRYRDSKGFICALELGPGRSPRPESVLELPIHLSYPFLVEGGDEDEREIYCVPESSAANEIALFRADDFPRRWSKAAVLVSGVAGIDPTVLRHDGRWWLLCTKKGQLEDVELWAWHAPSLLGPWTPHARNPVKSDVRGSRPAGRPFHHDGALYRPAQDCSKTYGWRIAIQRVTRLTPTEFAEERVRLVEAAPTSEFPLGRHTLTAVGDRVLVDGRRDVFVWAAFQAFLGILVRDWLRRALVRRGRRREPLH
jgi:hypothetical protein